MEELTELIKSLLPEEKRNVTLFPEGEFVLVGYYPKGNTISEKLPDTVISQLKPYYPEGKYYVYDVPEIKKDPVTGKRMQMTKIWVNQE